MMQYLALENGAIINVRNVTLKKGTFVKLQPHLTKFTQLSNPRVVYAAVSLQLLQRVMCVQLGEGAAQFLVPDQRRNHHD